MSGARDSQHLAAAVPDYPQTIDKEVIVKGTR